MATDVDVVDAADVVVLHATTVTAIPASGQCTRNISPETETATDISKRAREAGCSRLGR